jgi:hypothetical protein
MRIGLPCEAEKRSRVDEGTGRRGDAAIRGR